MPADPQWSVRTRGEDKRTSPKLSGIVKRPLLLCLLEHRPLCAGAVFNYKAGACIGLGGSFGRLRNSGLTRLTSDHSQPVREPWASAGTILGALSNMRRWLSTPEFLASNTGH